MPKNDLAQLLSKLSGSGQPITLDLTDDEEPPLVQDPLRGRHAMRRMSREGSALMKFLQAMGAKVGPEDLHEDTDEVLERIPRGRVLSDNGSIDELI